MNPERCRDRPTPCRSRVGQLRLPAGYIRIYLGGGLAYILGTARERSRRRLIAEMKSVLGRPR